MTTAGPACGELEPVEDMKPVSPTLIASLLWRTVSLILTNLAAELNSYGKILTPTPKTLTPPHPKHPYYSVVPDVVGTTSSCGMTGFEASGG